MSLPSTIRESLVHFGREQFVGADQKPCPEVIDITGRTRALLSGPLAPLAAGTWRVRLSLGLRPGLDHTPLIIQAVFGDHLVERKFTPARSGSYAVEMQVSSATDALFTVRVWNALPSFAGEVLFEGCVIERLAD